MTKVESALLLITFRSLKVRVADFSKYREISLVDGKTLLTNFSGGIVFTINK